MLVIRGLGVVLFFITTLFITNNFSAEGVGQYDFSRSLLIFLGAIALFGMQQSIIYYSGYLSAKKKLGQLKRVYLKMVVLTFGISIIIYGAGQLLQSGVLERYVSLKRGIKTRNLNAQMQYEALALELMEAGR